MGHSVYVSRGIHIELVQELSTSSFINALRRFLFIRGPVRQFRSDRGANFVGAVNELQMVHQYVEKPSVYCFYIICIYILMQGEQKFW